MKVGFNKKGYWKAVNLELQGEQMLDFHGGDILLAKDFMRDVWRASYTLSRRKPETTVEDIIFLLEEWIQVLRQERDRIKRDPDKEGD